MPLQGDEAPPELAQRLEYVILRLRAYAMLIEYPRIIANVAALFFGKLSRITIIVVNERMLQRSLFLIQHYDLVYLARWVVMSSTNFEQPCLVIGIPPRA